MSDESEARQASREAGTYVYSRLAASLLSLLSLAAAARFYTKSDFGYIASILLVYETAVALGSLGLADVVLYYIGRTPERAAHVVRQASFLLVCVAVPVIAIACVVGQLSFHLGSALPWLALTLIIELPTQPAVNQLLGVRRAGVASVLHILFAAFRPIAVLTPAVLGLPLTWIPVLMATLGVTRLAAHLAIVQRFFTLSAGEPPRIWLDKSALTSMLLFALPAGVAAIGGKLNPQIDKYVVGILYGKEGLGVYTAAAWELPLITLIPYAIGAVMQARYTKLFHEGKYEQLRIWWLATIRKTELLVLPLSLMFVALAEESIALVFGQEFIAAAPVFQIFTLTMLQRVTAYGPMLQSIGETRALVVNSALMVATNIALCYPLTYLVGMNGAAIATVVATIPPLLFTLWRISRALRTTIGNVMPWAHYSGTLAVSGCLAFALWSGRHYLPGGPGARLALGAVAYLTAFVLTARAVRLIGADDMRYLRDWLTLKMLRK